MSEPTTPGAGPEPVTPATPAAPAATAAPAERGPRRTARTSGILAAALVLGLVGGAGGATAAVALEHDNGSSSPQPTVVQAAGNSSTTDTEAVAKAVTPSVVLLRGAQQADEGSGVVLSSDGRILTNNHVVAAAAEGGSIQVVTSAGQTYDASIVGRDPVTDLAVVQAKDASGLQPAAIGDSGDLKVGEPVVAIGAPLGLQGTVTTGIVSALDRPVTATGEDGQATVTDAIQTDAAVNPGNSGGPLVDASGRVIGINSSIASLGQSEGSQAGSIGLGFAIPIDEAMRVAGDIQSGTPVAHAQLGVSVADSANPAGAKIGEVQAGSAADKAGIKAGDVVTKVDDQTVTDADGLVAAVRTLAPGTKVVLTLVRDGQTQTVDVTLGTDQTTT